MGRIDFLFDVEVQGTIASFLNVVYLNTIVFASLYVQLFLGALNAVAYFPDVHQCVAIDDEAQFVVSADVENEFLVGCGLEDTIQAGREVLQVNARGKHRVTTVAQLDGVRDVNGCHRLPLHFGVVPVDGLHALVA